MPRLLQAFLSLWKQYPYHSPRGTLWLCQLIALVCFPKHTFRTMSIVPLVKRAYKLESDEEFRVRYYVSRIGFEELWTSKSRQTKEDVETFYREHDKDIWRQAHISSGKYIYKRKILRTLHIIRAERIAHDAPILDYGGGSGALVHYLAKKGFSAVDIAELPSPSLVFVRKTMGGLIRNAITVDGSFALESGSYAVIVCLDVLEHTLDPLSIVRRFLAALRPGGILIVSFPFETDFSGVHTREAQEQRDATFALLRESCAEIAPQLVYRKRG